MTEIDIVPELLKTIQQEFDKQTFNSNKLKSAFNLLKNKKATYKNANDFAIEIGEILSNVLDKYVTVVNLPDGKMHFNIADRVLNSTMKKNYDLISGYALDVQENLNHLGKIGIKAQKPTINQNRIDGLINRLSLADNFEDVRWILNEPIVNFSQSIVDDAIHLNADFHAKSGLQPKITRQVVGHACEWCRNLAGTYDYYDAPNDIYRRHERCRCTVDYIPGKEKKQKIWTKEWVDNEKNEKKAQRKLLHLKSGGN